MAQCKILIYPKDKYALRKISTPVRSINRQTRRLIKDLKETLLANQNGVGLASPQIGVHQRVVVVRLGARNDWDDQAQPPVALVNPEIIEAGDEQNDFDGCLSFPGLYGETIRPHFLRVVGLDEDNEPFDRTFTGFDAVLVHHEVDHLDGVLFIDRITSLDDLYRVQFDDQGKPVRVLVSHILADWKGANSILGVME